MPSQLELYEEMSLLSSRMVAAARGQVEDARHAAIRRLAPA